MVKWVSIEQLPKKRATEYMIAYSKNGECVISLDWLTSFPQSGDSFVWQHASAAIGWPYTHWAELPPYPSPLWLPFKEKLPDEGAKILTHWHPPFPDRIYIDTYKNGTLEGVREDAKKWIIEMHWMPLPAPPAE